MKYELDLRGHFVKELDAMVNETTGMDATAILVSIVEGYLSPRVDVRVEMGAKARLAAFDAAPAERTKAEIVAAMPATVSL